MGTENKNNGTVIAWSVFIIFVILSSIWIENNYGPEALMKYLVGHATFIVIFVIRSISSKEKE